MTERKKRCPNGSHRNKKTSECESVTKKKQKVNAQPSKTRKRCPNGQHKNRKTGNCEKVQSIRKVPVPPPVPPRVPTPRVPTPPPVEKPRSASPVVVPNPPVIKEPEYKQIVSSLEKKLKLLHKYGTENSPFDFSEAISHVGHQIIMKKYKNKCAFDPRGIELSLLNDAIDNVDDIGKHLKLCIRNNVSLILIPLMLEGLDIVSEDHENDSFDDSNDSNAADGHQNMLVFRPFEGTVERFEPNGEISPGDEKKIDTILKKLFEKTLKPYIGDIKYKKTLEMSPYSNFQALESSLPSSLQEGEGYCTLWSVFFAEMILMNPDKSSKEILEEIHHITKSDPAFLKAIIRGYVMEITAIAKKYFTK